LPHSDCPLVKAANTAVADALLYTPILKHFLGIFGIISASKKSLQATLKKPGASGSVVLYVGGMAELFLSSKVEERIYLKKRKGFIKLAMQEGVDVIPVYLFGNTAVLSVLTNNFLVSFSRKFQVSFTYIWGKWGLPIPRDCKVRQERRPCTQISFTSLCSSQRLVVLYSPTAFLIQLMFVSGQPLGLPHIQNPTQKDIDHWHSTYCNEVTRIFDTYKERLPEYKHKKLFID
jgi:hypothetical protein